MTSAIPVTLITGLLGSGKSTLVQNLIQHKPANEQWGLIINEFGEVDIDGLVFEAQLTNYSSIYIEKVSGGCICCTAHLALVQALNNLLGKHHNLDRILIEPTGLGHPAKILDVLLNNNSQTFVKPIKLDKTVCLVTAMQLTAERWQKSQVMRDLVTLADTLIVNKMDLATPTQVASANTIIQQLYPAKQKLIYTEYAQINSSEIFSHGAQQTVLGEFIEPDQRPLLKILGANASYEVKKPSSKVSLLSLPRGKAPLVQTHLNANEQAYASKFTSTEHCFILPNEAHQLNSMGWIWQASTQFNRVQLKTFFASLSPCLQRAKGILKTGKEWQLVQWADNQLQLSDIAWRKDSRLELFFASHTANPTAAELEELITPCIHQF